MDRLTTMLERTVGVAGPVRPAPVLTLVPGERMVDGQACYSAAWLDDEQDR